MYKRNVKILCIFISILCLFSGCKNTENQANEPDSKESISSDSTLQAEKFASDIVLTSNGVSVNKQRIEVICDVTFADADSVKNVDFDYVTLLTPMGFEPGYVFASEIIESKENTKSCRFTYDFDNEVLLGKYEMTFENLIEGDATEKTTSFSIDKYNNSLQIPLNKTVFKIKSNDSTKYPLDLLEVEITEESLVVSYQFENDFQVVGGDVILGFSDGNTLDFNGNKDIDISGTCNYDTNTGHTIYSFDKIDLTNIENISILGEVFYI